MRVHSVEKIKEMKELRRHGYSINELVEKLSIPKTTIWHHVHSIHILPKYLPLLKAKRGGSALRKQNNLKKAKEYAEELLSGPNRELAISIAMLYWAEGSKKACEFINSDGTMIRFYLKILRNIFKIPNENIKPTMRIFTGMNKKQCWNYWSQITGIPKKEFIIRFNDGGLKGKTKYGMCRITVRKGSNMLKLMYALIERILEERKNF
ncbi:MAG: hypothetical protein HY773_02630 [Candidatus Terrybacteria bacterium]|nr:hypothetical protein [Candidatus Terrybacteria bacterium]